jgi:hypothetical protein
MSKKKHLNKITVFGTIKDIRDGKSRNKRTPYADVFVRSSSDKGDIVTKCRVWHLDTIGDLKQTKLESPETIFSFSGEINQYEKDGRMFFGCNGFDADRRSPEEEQRVSFIVIGKFEGSYKHATRETTVLNMVCINNEERENKINLEIRDNHHAALGFDPEKLKSGDQIQVAGYVYDEDMEFGSSGDIAPIVTRFTYLEQF